MASNILINIENDMSYKEEQKAFIKIAAKSGHYELTTNSGEKLIISKRWHKHIPTQVQVYNWLSEAGFSIERTYQNFTDEPIPEPIGEATKRAIIWAKKI